jgi:hypothetical protein
MKHHFQNQIHMKTKIKNNDNNHYRVIVLNFVLSILYIAIYHQYIHEIKVSEI